MPVALTIAGSDPTGGAGLEADLRVFQHLGLHGMALATALTIQDSARVHGHEVVRPGFFAERMKHLLADIKPDVIKFGMLASAALIQEVLSQLNRLPEETLLVLDPVLVSSSGHPLLDEDGLRVLVAELVPRVQVICPNQAEAAILMGREASPEELALALSHLGPRVVCVTGGDADELLARDFVVIDGELKVLEAKRHKGPSPHGTGCAFASALASYMALGYEAAESVDRAKCLVNEAIGAAEMMKGAQGRPFLRFGGSR